MNASNDGPASYGSLLGNLRAHVRSYIAKHFLLPRQEMRELIVANLDAAKFLALAASLLLLGGIGLVVLVIALLALLPKDWLGTAVLAIAAGVAVALLWAAIRARSAPLFLAAFVGAVALVALGVVALLFLPELVLAGLLITLALFSAAAAMGYAGSRRLVLHGPERTIRSMKETVSWVKATLLGRSES